MKKASRILVDIGQAQQALIGTELLAPYTAGRIATRVAGLPVWLTVPRPAVTDMVFCVWRITSEVTAEYVRPAGRHEVGAYLELLPRHEVIALAPAEDGQYPAILAHRGDRRLQTLDFFPVRLTSEAAISRFDSQTVRFDGRQFWHERPAAGRIIGSAMRLLYDEERDALSELSGVTPEQHYAFTICWTWRLEEQANARRAEMLQRLAQERAEEAERQQRPALLITAALKHGGGRYLAHQEWSGGTYRIEYEIAGRRHISIVRRDDLTVETAGVCLSGEDKKFDLQSLMGVMAEHRRRGRTM